MTSLVYFLRKRLMLGSQCPSLEEEAEWYIKQFEKAVRDWPRGIINDPMPGVAERNKAFEDGFENCLRIAVAVLSGETEG